MEGLHCFAFLDKILYVAPFRRRHAGFIDQVTEETLPSLYKNLAKKKMRSSKLLTQCLSEYAVLGF